MSNFTSQGKALKQRTHTSTQVTYRENLDIPLNKCASMAIKVRDFAGNNAGKGETILDVPLVTIDENGLIVSDRGVSQVRFSVVHSPQSTSTDRILMVDMLDGLTGSAAMKAALANVSVHEID